MTEIQETQKLISDLKDTIKAKEDMKSLYQNSAFKRLILDNFCKDKVLKQMELAVSGHTTEAEEIKADAEAGLRLKAWLSSIEAMGTRAEDMLPRYEEELNTLIAENRGE